METNFLPQIVPATPEYVLSVIVDDHRQQSQYDPEADPDAVLTLDTTVAEWRNACDLVGWRGLGRALNDYWDIRCTDRQWETVLTPASQRTLRDVCSVIASHATRQVIRPVTLLGKPCDTAGAFLTVRSLLRQAGADVRPVRPSTPLAPYLRQHVEVFLGPISRLAPGALPPVEIRTPLYDRAVIGFVASLVLIILGWLVSPLCAALGAVSAGFFYALVWVAAKSRPASVEFGGVQTFRDLAMVLAAARTR